MSPRAANRLEKKVHELDNLHDNIADLKAYHHAHKSLSPGSLALIYNNNPVSCLRECATT